MEYVSVSKSYNDTYVRIMRDIVLAAADTECTIFLFGSRARGIHRRNSDIDIGISGLGELAFVRLRDKFLSVLEESIIPHHVDFVNFETVSADFRDVASKEVIVWKRSLRAN